MSPTADPLLDAVRVLARAGVEFVVVGVQGINFYARDPSEAVVTQDVDVFLPPRPDALQKALRALHDAGFSFVSRGEPFLDWDDPSILRNVVRSGANIVAEDGRGARIDLMLSGGGFDYAGLAADAVRFRLDDVEVRVGALARLLRSKELAGRPKDVEFLRMFAARLREEAGPA